MTPKEKPTVTANAKLTDRQVDAATRIKRAQALAEDRSQAGLDELLAGLELGDEALRDPIVAALQKRKAGPALLERSADAKRATPDRVRALGALRALKPTDAGVAVAALLDPLKVTDEVLRSAAAHALCVFGTAEAEAQLIRTLRSDPSAKVRYFAAFALGELKSEPAKAAVRAQRSVEKDFLVVDALEVAQRKQAAK